MGAVSENDTLAYAIIFASIIGFMILSIPFYLLWKDDKRKRIDQERLKKLVENAPYHLLEEKKSTLITDLVGAHRTVFMRYIPVLENSEISDRVRWIDFCRQGMELTNPDKMSRWIRFIQGILYSNGLIDIDVERDWTRSVYKPVYQKWNLANDTVSVSHTHFGSERKSLHEANEHDVILQATTIANLTTVNHESN